RGRRNHQYGPQAHQALQSVGAVKEGRMPESVDSRVMFTTYRAGHTTAGPHWANVQVPEGYRVISGGLFVEEHSPDHIALHASRPLYDDTRGVISGWGFQYSLDIPLGNSLNVGFHVIAERSSELDTLIRMPGLP